MQLPRLSSYDDTPIYNTRAAVKLTQVEAPRLRAWERRYAILSPHRSTNSYRLYSERDLAIIRWLREQVEAGMTISQATSYLKSSVHQELEAIPQPVEAALPNLDGLGHDLVKAALRLDEIAATRLLNRAFAISSVEEVCETVLRPALYAIGEAWIAGQDVIVAEHFLVNMVRARLDAIWQLTYQPEEGPGIVMACVPGEQHDLGAFMLALFLRRRGLRVTFLGQNVDAPSLLRAVQQMRHHVVCLSATTSNQRAPLLDLALEVHAASPAPIFIGGQALMGGENGKTLPPGITALHASGTEAAEHIKKAIH